MSVTLRLAISEIRRVPRVSSLAEPLSLLRLRLGAVARLVLADDALLFSAQLLERIGLSHGGREPLSRMARQRARRLRRGSGLAQRNASLPSRSPF